MQSRPIPRKVVGQSMTRLTVAKHNAISNRGKHGDGGGPYLRVSPTGRKSWMQQTTIDGRRREIGLGAYPTGSLEEARACVFAGHYIPNLPSC